MKFKPLETLGRRVYNAKAAILDFLHFQRPFRDAVAAETEYAVQADKSAGIS